MLSAFDDYPVHQVPRPMAEVGTSDLNFYDRYFFNGYTPDGDVFFAAAMGLYPNRSVIDAAFSVVRNGEQVSLFASGRAPLERTHTRVGPIRVEVVAPLQVLRLVVESEEVAASLTFHARTKPVQEPPFHRQVGIHTVMDSTRMTQMGTWEGWVRVGDEHIDVRRDVVVGSRDRSWGVRGVGERAPGAPGPLPQYYWLWAPVNFDDLCTHFDVNEEADGRRWHDSGFVIPVGDGEGEQMARVDYRIGWRPGTRRADWFEVDLVPHRGDPLTVRLEPLFEFQMAGIGYLHPSWGHGTWKGEEASGVERWSLAEVDPLAFDRIHVQALCRATAGGRVGVGVLEQLVLGPHEPSGMAGLFDGAP